MSNDAAATPPPPPAGGGGGAAAKIPLVLGVLNMALSGFLVFTAMKAPKAITVVAEAEGGGGEHGDKGGDKEGAGPVVAFDPFVINLNEPGSNRYLKTSLELEVLDKKSEEMVTEKKRVVRDELLRYLSSLGVADTLGEENKTKIKTALLARADHAVGGKGKVRNVFLTEFVVQ